MEVTSRARPVAPALTSRASAAPSRRGTTSWCPVRPAADREFKRTLGKVAYLRLVPGTTVELLERCSGMDGTWGFKHEFYEGSCKVARPLARALDEVDPDLLLSDCPLAALAMEEVRASASATPRRTRSPAERDGADRPPRHPRPRALRRDGG
jgi:hypothetical protein